MAVDLEQPYFQFLPENLWEEILSRLPVKTLVRFRCVSKQWKSLISNSFFKSLHHKNTTIKSSPPSLLRLSCDIFRHDKPYPQPHILITFNFAGEVLDQWILPVTADHVDLLPTQPEYNKLVCFTDRIRFFVCNPSTKRCIELPDSYPLIAQHALKDLRDYPAGFAYLPWRDEYVIVQLTRFGWFGVLTLSISNHDNKLIYDNWKIVKADLNFYQYLDPWGIFVNGSFYWLMNMPERQRVLSFDVEKEKFSRFKLPFETEFSIMQIKGRVSILQLKGGVYINYTKPIGTTIELWKLEEDDHTWSKKYSICRAEFEWCRYSILWPIFMNGKGEILFCNVGFLKYYNPEKKMFREEAGSGSMRRLTRGNMILHTDNMFLLEN